MNDQRSPWRRAFGPGLVGLSIALAVSGGLVLALAKTNLVKGIGAFLLALCLIALLCGVFLAIGYGEDDERRGR